MPSYVQSGDPSQSSFPLLPTDPHAARMLCRWRPFLRPNGALRIGVFFTAFILSSLIAYATFFTPHGSSLHLTDWHFPSHSLDLVDPSETLLVDPKLTSLLPTPTPGPSPPSASPVSDVLTPEQIRDVVAPTRGFFSRDYSLGLGWNNMRYIIEAALLEAELLNRTLVLPSFIYARACEYNISVCADYAPMVNKGDAIGWDEWRELPFEQQMAFRIPISLMVNITHLRSRQPVITVSEYLRLHGQSPESESTSGFWPRESYHTHPNIFETNKTKMPSLFVIENHWYDPAGTNRVDYIPEAMKRRGNLERHPGPDNYDGGAEYWPPLEPTGVSSRLAAALPEHHFVLDWNAAKNVLTSSDLGEEAGLDDDGAVEELLNVHGWEVLHTFQSAKGMDFAKTVVNHLTEVAPRSSIRGFRDDYYDVDADVVVLAGETHLYRKPGSMRFTGALARNRYANTVVHSLIPPQKVFDLAEVLANRMRHLTEDRLWMGAHMRRGDFIRLGWATEMDPEAHVQRVKERLLAGRSILADMHGRSSHLRTYDLDGAQPNLEQATLPPPRVEDPFFVATDERDPDARRKIAAAGALFMSDLITMDDRREFGWPLMVTDVLALVEQQLLAHSAFFYGHGMSSLAGVITNLRAARGADPRTMLLD
ncbi:hypothetical protein EDB89DRAFT_2063636 [Lactarius sanguifluus]|nr:hypothetical protein EDB89DRAFT_2063636 [Lactarius sanguifluus]